MAGGAFDFLEKPCAPADLLAVVDKALKTRELVLENRRLKREVRRGDAAARMLVGTSALSEQMREAARRAARTSAEVLITGAPGAGTAKMAEVIHLLSAAAMRPFQKISAATATPETLAAAFERAEGGSIFLDEVAALPQAAQFALARPAGGAGRHPGASPAPTATWRARPPKGGSTPTSTTSST